MSDIEILDNDEEKDKKIIDDYEDNEFVNQKEHLETVEEAEEFVFVDDEDSSVVVGFKENDEVADEKGADEVVDDKEVLDVVDDTKGNKLVNKNKGNDVAVGKGNRQKKNKDNKNTIIDFLLEYVPYVLILITIVIFKTYFYSPLYVHGESMMNTLHDGDLMILDIYGYKQSGLKRFDIVVIDIGSELIIKRVIGLPGENIKYVDNVLYVNDEKVEDSHARNITEDFEVTVPAGQYFVLGDNRQNSLDSRSFGSFSEDKIMGKTKFIFFPFDRFGSKE